MLSEAFRWIAVVALLAIMFGVAIDAVFLGADPLMGPLLGNETTQP